MSGLLKRIRRSGTSGDGEEPERRKGKEPMKEKAPAKGKGASKDKGKRKASEGASENPFGIIFRNDEQRARYDSLIARKIICTRYSDDSTMITLGIKDDIEWMLDNIGWIEFMNFRHPTYQGLTLEFLSSLDVHYTSDENNEGVVSFRMLNEEYRWTLDEFNNCFRMPIGVTRNIDRKFNTKRFWRLITDSEEPYDPSKSKASLLQNPVFRYLHRVMSKTIFGRAESDGVVRKLELYCFWVMLNQVDFNSGFHFLQHLVKIANSSTGVICIGGFITVIASFLGCQLDRLSPLLGNSMIDIDTCMAMRMICRFEGGYAFKRASGLPFLLPNPSRTTIRETANWILRSPVPSHASTPMHESETEHSHEPSYHPGPSYHEPSYPRAEPARHSFAYGESGSAYDFSAFRTSLDTLHEEHSLHHRQLEQYGAMSQEQFKEVQEHFTRADEFYSGVDEFMVAQSEEWRREEEFRRSMDLTRQQVASLFQYHEHLGTLPNFPRFPPRFPKPFPPDRPPPPPGQGGR